MEEKTIEISNNMGRVRLDRTGSIKMEHDSPVQSFCLGEVYGDTARKFAEAILELLGDEPKPKGDDCYIVVEGEAFSWSAGKILDGASWAMPSAMEELLDGNLWRPGEFHIFRRVATVGPIPQPSERKVTRYE